MSDAVVTVLGCRGSVPVSGSGFSHYGGATCCVFVRAGEEIAVLDAGTGMMSLSSCLRGERYIPVLLSHCHADHLLGLPMCPEVMRKDNTFAVYGASRGGEDVQTQLCALMSPPLWPVQPCQLPAVFVFHETKPRMEIGTMLVESMEGCHPGGVTVFRLTAEGKKIVYMTDCTITEENRAKLLEFACGCDLLLCDGQYSDEQWGCCSGFGHNRWTEVARFGAECGAKAVRVVHHSPANSDQVLHLARDQVREICPVCDLAFEGEEIVL